MSQRLFKRPERRSDPVDRLDQQISIGFLPIIADLLVVVARARGTTTSKLLGETVSELVIEAERNPDVINKELRSYAHRLPAVVAGDRALHDPSPAPRHGPKPRYTKRLSAYVSEDMSARLDRLCADTGIGRARMMRMAVDKYLFEELVNANLRNFHPVHSH
ncbi:ribbon-helix-helix domain-containing protein [Mycobacterium sp. shizuoka-1]|uniref:ribbon-helix-helix domain-containing protein n=1 Tax=Mycobacterium sp. shizuoka-1 TaxID=2039281 RepID=UPI000C063C20|nr:ribbon-helix-helix domain-containing protein [Mycobacterium sp. shizuoka-1]GAY19297.1 hypothetical protein MSZK_60230 [Mycobacterium sp. shizuoka-1]